MATDIAAAQAAPQIGIQDFIRILVAQLGNQDPLKPMDNTEFVTQLAQFTSLQQTQDMNAKLDVLLVTQAAMQSVGLLGREVDFTTNAGAPSSGKVRALSFTAGSPQLTVHVGPETGGSDVTGITLASITAVR